MSNLQDTTIDEIECKIMSILYANMDMTFTQYTLFNKLLTDKYDWNGLSIHPSFKSKFLLILKNLMSKYDDIKVSKENNSFSVVCSSRTDDIPIEFKQTNFSNPVNLNKVDLSEMYDYIYDNNLTEYLETNDPWEQNTIFHELVLADNIKQIQRLVEIEQFNFNVQNKCGLTPFDLANELNSKKIIKIFFDALIKKNNKLKENLNSEHKEKKIEMDKLKVSLSYLNSKEYSKKIVLQTKFTEFYYVKISYYYTKYKLFILVAIICFFVFKFLVN